MAPGAARVVEEVLMITTMGSFTIELYSHHAPKTCQNFLELYARLARARARTRLSSDRRLACPVRTAAGAGTMTTQCTTASSRTS